MRQLIASIFPRAPPSKCIIVGERGHRYLAFNSAARKRESDTTRRESDDTRRENDSTRRESDSTSRENDMNMLSLFRGKAMFPLFLYDRKYVCFCFLHLVEHISNYVYGGDVGIFSLLS